MADEEFLPFPQNTFDLVVSSLRYAFEIQILDISRRYYVLSILRPVDQVAESGNDTLMFLHEKDPIEGVH